MAVPFSNTKLRVPRGFQNLLEGLAKEVLRNQPDNIYAFAAVYFSNLLKIREEQGIDPAEIGAKHEDRFYNNKAFSKAGNIGDVSDPQQQEAATTIQAAVRGQQAREGVSEEKSDKEKSEEDDAAVKIQAAYRGYEARKRVNLLKEGEQNEESRTEEKTEEIDIDLNDPEVEKAATMIQKSYRGFHVRKSLQSDKDNPPEAPEPPGEVPSEESPPEAAHPVEEKTTQEETAPSEEKTPEEAAPTETTPEDKETAEEIDIDLTDPEVEKAALKIQGGFRGLKVRKEMKEMKEKDTADKEEDVTETEEKTEEQVEETEKTSPAEEEIDIDLNDPEVGKAALKIQAGFRGYKDRKNFKNDEKGKLETVSSKKDQYQAESSSQVIPSVAGSNEMFSHIDASDPQVNLAASKIQAGFKGMMVRNQLHGTGLSQTVGLSGSKNSDLVNPEVIDIDLNDPEVQGAALKIQKGFKRKTQGRQNRNVKECKINVSLVGNKQGGDGYVQNANKDMNARKNTTGTGNQVKDIIPGPSVGPVSYTVRPQEQRYNSQEKRVFSSSINIVPGRVISSSHSKVLKRQVDPHKSINNKPEEVGDKLGENHGENKTRGTELTEETRINNEEEVDIDLTDPEVEKAALKIQNSFKGKFKKKAPSKGKQTLPSSKEMEKSVEDNNVMVPEKIKQATEEEIDIDLNDPEVEKAALKIQNSFKGKFKKKMGDKTTEGEGNGNFKFVSKTSQSVKNQKDVKIPLEEEIDIDLNDPDVEKAALKIQSSFKGKFQKKVNRNYQNLGTSAEEGSQVYKGRIKVQGSIGSDIGESELGNIASLERKPNEVPESVNHHKHLVGMGKTKVRAETEVDLYLTDPEVQRAAIHNQAGYKGFQKRKKEVKEGEADDKGDGEDAGKEEPDTKEEDSKDDEEKEESKPKEEEEVDIDLTDPEVEQAAIKIQAGFKTMMNKKKKTEEDTAGDADNAATTEAKEEEGTSEEAPVTANEEKQPSALPVEGELTTEEDVPPVSEEVAADTTPADTTGGGSPVVAEATPAEEDVETAEGDGNATTTEDDGNAATTEGDGKEATTEGDGKEATTEDDGKGDEKAAASSDEVPAEAEPTPMEGTSEEKPEEGTDEKPNDA
ncbi:Sperm surface protein Sp17 [Holothuria leucospilota]|uniref:Sperm surface protein Sp17 n=1 Tax=Holothuria leucospilota TaxID=206669 RepID=A0A9Q0YD04_HOLLE|nr:Sperm surface protein Sp17 [Holothuria leucospilota]